MIQGLKAFDGIEEDKKKIAREKPYFATVTDYKEEAGHRLAKVIFDGDSVATETYLQCINAVATGQRVALYYAGGYILILGGV